MNDDRHLNLIWWLSNLHRKIFYIAESTLVRLKCRDTERTVTDSCKWMSFIRRLKRALFIIKSPSASGVPPMAYWTRVSRVVVHLSRNIMTRLREEICLRCAIHISMIENITVIHLGRVRGTTEMRIRARLNEMEAHD